MSSQRKLWLVWAGIWLLAAFFMAAQVGFWDDVSGPEFEDATVFEMWSDFIAANHALPIEDSWQYPPGAAFLFLLPRIGGDFGESFVALMLLFYLAGLILLAVLAKRTGRNVGVWVWLLAMPLLFTLPVLRFDLVPTVFAIAALVVIHRRPVWFGVLAGVGAMVKVWPVVVLLGEWDRRRLLIAAGAAIATAAVMFGVAGIAFGDQTGFFSNQEARGLQVEAVASTPWYLRQVVTGEVPNVEQRFGTNEIASGPADAVSAALKWISLAILIGAAVWWVLRERGIRRGREDLTMPEVSRDFIFTIVLWLVVASRVLSPQFMIWLLGLAAVVLTAGSTRLARPAWIVVGAIVLTAGLYQSPANFVLRNVALLVAAIDAAIAMYVLLRPLQAEEPEQRRSDSAVAEPSTG